MANVTPFLPQFSTGPYGYRDGRESEASLSSADMHRQRAVCQRDRGFPGLFLRPLLEVDRVSRRCSDMQRSSEMDEPGTKPNFQPAQEDAAKGKLNRRSLLLGGATLVGSAMAASAPLQTAQAQVQMPAPSSAPKPNILVILGDDIGIPNICAYFNGLMEYAPRVSAEPGPMAAGPSARVVVRGDRPHSTTSSA